MPVNRFPSETVSLFALTFSSHQLFRFCFEFPLTDIKWMFGINYWVKLTLRLVYSYIIS